MTVTHKNTLLTVCPVKRIHITLINAVFLILEFTDSLLLVKWYLLRHPHTRRHNEALQAYYTRLARKITASPFT